jgi:Uma2 family endonuclease
VRLNSPGVKLTYDDFVLFPDDGKRHELIDGEHFVTPSPTLKHQKVLGNLHLLIGNWLEPQPIGQIYCAPFDVVFSTFDVVEPDLLYMSNERAEAVLTEANVQGAPELVIEIGSPSTRQRDETIKRRLYERAGVSEYWFVDPEIDVVRVYRRNAEGFARPLELTAEAGDTLTTPFLCHSLASFGRRRGGDYRPLTVPLSVCRNTTSERFSEAVSLSGRSACRLSGDTRK